jgi:transcriptional regulator with XRE-family HTH domain
MAGDAEIGSRIRAAREAASLTLRELAERVGIDITRLSRIETGERTIPAKTLTDLAHALRLTVSQLAGADVAEASGEYAADHPARQILADYEAPGGLRDLAAAPALSAALRITPEEWRMLAALAKHLPPGISRDGYVQVLITVRGVAPRVCWGWQGGERGVAPHASPHLPRRDPAAFEGGALTAANRVPHPPVLQPTW